MFHFTGFLSTMESRVCTRGVAPFRYPRIKACLRLPAAFRRLLRLSSAVSAKASVVCPFYLNLFQFRPVRLSNGWARERGIRFPEDLSPTLGAVRSFGARSLAFCAWRSALS